MAPSTNFSADETALRPAILNRLHQLRPGTTLCPGQLAADLGLTQATLRPHLAHLQQTGQIQITQNSQPASLTTLRGPYRVAPAPPRATRKMKKQNQ